MTPDRRTNLDELLNRAPPMPSLGELHERGERARRRLDEDLERIHRARWGDWRGR